MQRLAEAQRTMLHVPERDIIDETVASRMEADTALIDFEAVDRALEEPPVKGGQGREALDVVQVAFIAAVCVVIVALILVAVGGGR